MWITLGVFKQVIVMMAKGKLERIMGCEVREVKGEPDRIGHHRSFKTIVFIPREMSIHVNILRVT